MGRSQIFPSNHCLLLLLLAQLSCAQYEHWPYLPGYPEPAPQVFQPPQTAPNTPKIQLRLAGQKRKHNEGRLEVFYGGEWGTVCDDDFSIHAAHVACRELGYVEAVSWLPGSKYGKGEGKIWLDNVHCTGRESSLAACGSNGWGVSDCKHSEDVGVVCSEKRIPGFKFDNSLINQIENMNIQVEDIRIRAILATYRKRVPVTEGYVEVKDEGSWKQICDQHWTMKNSRVVCGMFGFPSERKYNTNVYKMFASRRKQHYWPYSMECSGSEAHISSCKLGAHNGSCARGMPAVVSCVPGRAFAPSAHSGFRKAFRQEQPLVRLKGGANTGEGRVEVLKNGEWGTVCDDSWNLVSASVVCRELGFGSAREAITGARLGQGMGPIHLNEIDCTGFEKSVTDCKFNTESQGCNHEEDAAVRCNVPAMGFQNQLRLSGGRTPYEGRVEVLAERNGTLRWGTVCSHNWGTVEAMVVCRQLGLGFASHAFQETWYWHGDVSADDVVMSGVKCSGTEMSLSHCRHDGARVSCPRGGGRFGAGVSCSETAPDLVLNAELVEQTAYLEDRPMFLLQCALEENCLASSAHNTSLTSGYRRLLRFSSQIHNNGQSDFRPKNGRHAWVWHDCHRHYHSMEVFTHYDLLNLNGTKVAEGHKASFCLEDTECEADVQKQYECANFGEQGITVGCWDVYRHDIDCQWIDITDVPPGDYLFQVVINPNYEVAESDYSNNVMKCRSRYDGQRIWMYNCHIGGSFSEETEQKFDHFRGLTNNNVPAR
ncbi:lysyl oxidase homolog 2 isoform X2 [Oenanthe melanoleuca]|uniref:lysyl oxidase homolog 2 isoform X1 n=2 Tax=Oenanthe melanoleuca TaxID=2939378 RepID=UPI0024C19CAF|nr:lysyl oxidase homolog 2 isoform X1 [Oenanthe melanoleuca]XP_056364659.1 lysyl oxidase homolog 2 isoform X2 [Oenanthe melanoleuca]